MLRTRAFWPTILIWSAAIVAAATGRGLAAKVDGSLPDSGIATQAPAAQAPAPQTPPPQTPAPQPSAAGYAGTDTCVVCHEQQGNSLRGTPHGLAANPRSPAATRGCESCHGPGQAHVDDDAKGNIVKFASMRPAEVSETCLTCHNRGAHAGLGR